MLLKLENNNGYFTWRRRSQWPRCLSCRSTAARLLRLCVPIPPEAWMFVCCDCCVLSGRGLCDGFITHPEESYRLWRVVACDQETPNTRRLKSVTGLWKIQPQWVVTPGKQTTNSIWRQIYLFIISRSVFLSIRSVSDKSCRENQNTRFVFSNFFLSKIVQFMR